VIEALSRVTVAVADLDLAASAYEALLGRPGARHEAQGGARHALFQLSNMALDLIQPDGVGSSGEQARARLAAAGEGLWSLVFAVSDLAEARRMLGRRGAPASDPGEGAAPGARDCAMIDPQATHGVSIALTQTQAPCRSRPAFAADEVHGLDHVVIRTTNPDRALALYAARLGLDFRLDRSNRQWGSRLMFFRCGDCVIEVGAALDVPVSAAPDQLSGLAWRVRDPDGAHERMASARLDVSAVRPGRKPGTRVFTVRSGIAGGPALVIGGSD